MRAYETREGGRLIFTGPHDDAIAAAQAHAKANPGHGGIMVFPVLQPGDIVRSLTTPTRWHVLEVNADEISLRAVETTQARRVKPEERGRLILLPPED